jgi:serine/threonine protein kinase
LSNEPNDDALIDIALAVADGGEIPWKEVRERLASENAGVVDALQAVSRLSLARRSPADSTLAVPSRWGHLNILGILPSGGATQYVARDDALGKEVVLTLIGPVHGDSQLTEQLLQQARLRTRLSHPQLAAVYGADYAQDRIGYWTELIEGRTVADIVSSGGRYGVSQACHVVATLSGAVGALHRAGLSNGGISAEQVIESTDQRIVLVPSICVPPLGEAASEPICTPDSDIFGLGALLLLLLTGISVQQPLEPAVLTERMRETRPDVRPSVVAVIQRCFSSDPQFRFSSTADLEHAIGMAITEGPVTAEWVIGFVVTTLVILLLLWYALVPH